MLIGKYRVDNLVEAPLTRATGGVWPFPFKTAPREGIVQAEVYSPKKGMPIPSLTKAEGSPGPT